MIRLFDRNETNFDHNETILSDVLSAKVIEEGNGMFEVEIEHPRNEFAKTLTAGKIIKVPTARGEQLFRIYKPLKNLTRYKLYARHIFYDLAKNFIEDIRPTGKSGAGAINDILTAAQYPHPFTGTSNINDVATAYYLRMNPLQALLGPDNSFLDTWGGELVRDNFTFSIDAAGGTDRGYEIRIGKNLTGIDVTMDESAVYTRLYPTVVIDNNVVTTLPEKYMDSPLIGVYEYPKIIEERISLTNDQKGWPVEDIYTLMRNHCSALFDAGVDKPAINYKVDFIELSKTAQYKELQILEQLDLYDTVTIRVAELDIDIKAKVVKTTYDGLKERYISMELGSFKDNMASQAKNTLSQTDKKINAAASNLQQAFDKAQGMITGNLGGYRIDRYNAEGLPYETLWMDTPDINTAVNVIRINQQGIGFSQSGYNGPFGVAITIDGHIVADFIDAGTLSADLVRTGTLSGDNFWLNLLTSVMRFIDPATQATLDLDQAKIVFNAGTTYERIITWTGEGAMISPGPNNTGTNNNTSWILEGPDGSHKYIHGRNTDFDDQEHNQRITMINDVIRFHSISGVEFRDNFYYDGRDKFVESRAGAYYLGGSGLLGMWEDEELWAIINGYSGVGLKVNGTTLFGAYAGGLEANADLYMNGHTIWNESDEELKLNILPTDIDAIAETKRQNIVEFEWDLTNPHNVDKPQGRQLGLIAQDAGVLQIPVEQTGKGYLGVDVMKQINLNTLANQTLISDLETTKKELADLKTLLKSRGVIA